MICFALTIASLELTFLNLVRSACGAVEGGLVNRVFPDDQYPQEVQQMATSLAQGPMEAYGRAKALFSSNTSDTLATQLEHDAHLMTSGRASVRWWNNANLPSRDVSHTKTVCTGVGRY